MKYIYLLALLAMIALACDSPNYPLRTGDPIPVGLHCIDRVVTITDVPGDPQLVRVYAWDDYDSVRCRWPTGYSARMDSLSPGTYAHRLSWNAKAIAVQVDYKRGPPLWLACVACRE